ERGIEAGCGNAAADVRLEQRQGRGFVAVFPEQVHGLLQGGITIESAGAAHLCHGGIPLSGYKYYSIHKSLTMRISLPIFVPIDIYIGRFSVSAQCSRRAVPAPFQ